MKIFRHRCISSILVFVALVLADSARATGSDIDQARTLRSQGRDYEAFELLEQTLEPLTAEGLLLKGVLLAELGRTTEAKRIFLELIKDQPDSPEPFNNLAAIYAAAGDYDLALKSLRHAIATRPEFLTTYENLNQVSTRMATEAYGRETGRNLAEDHDELALVLLPELTRDGSLSTASNLAKIDDDPTTLAPGISRSELHSPVVEVVEADVSSDKTEAAPVATGASYPPVETPRADPGLAWNMVLQWATARSSSSHGDFAAFYSREFQPGRGITRQEWSERLALKFESNEPLSIALEFLEARRTGSGQSEVRFRQTLSVGANSFGATVTLGLVWEEGSWKIQSEYRNQ